MGLSRIILDALQDLAVTTAKLANGAVTQAKLATNVAGNGPAFSAYLNGSSQSLASINTFYKVTLNSEDFDTASAFDSSTNYRFFPLVAGYYLISAQAYFNGSVNPGIVWTSIFKNGSEYKTSALYGAGSTNGGTPATAIVYLNGSTDYVEMYVKFTVVGSGVVVNNGSTTTYMSGSLIRSA